MTFTLSAIPSGKPSQVLDKTLLLYTCLQQCSIHGKSTLCSITNLPSLLCLGKGLGSADGVKFISVLLIIMNGFKLMMFNEIYIIQIAFKL